MSENADVHLAMHTGECIFGTGAKLDRHYNILLHNTNRTQENWAPSVVSAGGRSFKVVCLQQQHLWDILQAVDCFLEEPLLFETLRPSLKRFLGPPQLTFLSRTSYI